MSDPAPFPDEVRALLDRSNRLGSDPAVTNYGGGNTSAKVTVTSPASGDPVELLYVKGSGGDLGTLTADGLAVLERDRLVGLDRVYRGVEHEDEMVGLFAYCGHGSGGAAPSIDTPMHALVDHGHVDHLHPDSVIALACAADGREAGPRDLGRVGGVGAVEAARLGAGTDDARAVHRSGRHRRGPRRSRADRLGPTSQEVEERSLRIIREAAAYLVEKSVDRAVRSGRRHPDRTARGRPPEPGRRPLPPPARSRLRATAVRSATTPTATWCSTSSPARRRTTWCTWGPAVPTTSCAPRCARSSSTPHRTLRSTRSARGWPSCRRSTARSTARTTTGTRRRTPPRCGAPRRPSSWCPGIGMFSFGADKQTARVAGEFYVNAINVMRGAEGVSTYAPVDEADKFARGVLDPRGAEAAAPAEARSRSPGGRLGHGSRLRHRSRDRPRSRGRRGQPRHRRPRRGEGPRVATELGGPDRAAGVVADVTDDAAVTEAVNAAVLAFGGVDLLVNNAGITRAGSLATRR